jgi:thioredoxin reductase (NADPH)
VRQEHPAAPDGTFGGDVTYQLQPGSARFADRPVVVVGGGDSATLDALELAEAGSPVTLVHRSEQLRARHDIVARVRLEPRITDLPGWELDAVRGGAGLEQVILVRPATGERRALPACGLVLKISRVPNTAPFRGQVELDRRGFVLTDAGLQTSLAGVFAAGDVVAGAYWRVAYALGQGLLAARSILGYLEGRPGCAAR